MKKLAYIFAAVALLVSCAKEEINHPSEAQAPASAAAYEPVITVDQELNQVTFSVNAKGVIPVWLFANAKTGEFTDRFARNNFTRIFTNAGDYKVRMQVMNAAGVTPDYVEKTFHIDNTIMDFGKYVTILAGGTDDTATRSWHLDGTVEAHMGCGPAGSEGLEWWSAKPGDKEAFGVYEDKVTFGGNYSYAYDPGDDGSTYVNVDGVTVSPFIDQKGDATADYNVKVDPQTASYNFEVDGDDLYLVLPAHTLFPYIDNDGFWAEPRFKVLEAKPAGLVLVHDNGDIAWHFILTSKEGPVKFNGFKYNAESNLWLPADGAHTFSQYTATGGSWEGLPNPEITEENGVYSFTYDTETSAQWQAQFHIIPDTPVVLEASKNYDFSVILSVSKTVKNATLKLTDVGDDGNFLFANNVEMPAGDDLIYYLSDVEGIDAPNGVKMVFDFGGCDAGTEVTITHIVLKDHAVDDGTVLPSEEPEEPTPGYTYGDNLLTGLSIKETWFSPSDWSGGLDPQAKYEGGKLTLTVPEGVGGSEWQGQVKLVANVPADPEKQYAFFATIEASNGGTATIKVADANADAEHAFFYDNGVVLEAFTPMAYKNEPIVPDQAYEAVMVIFDFGRMPAGTEISVSGIELREITGTTGGGGNTYGDEMLGGLTLKETWFSPGDWSGGLDPQAKYEGGTLTLTCPEGIGGGEWQGQVKLVANVPADPEKQYAFFATIEASNGGTATIKVADANADAEHAFFYDNGAALEAFTPMAYKNEPIVPDQAYEAVMVIFDFGRMPAGTEISVSGIELREITGTTGGGGNTYGDEMLGGLTLKETWFSPGDWSGGLDPQAKFEGGTLTLTCPEGIGGGEWQGQVKLVANVPADPEKQYAFAATIEASNGGTATIKVADANADAEHAFFYDNGVVLEAYEALTYKNEPIAPDQAYEAVMVIFDFGRMPAGTEIVVSGMSLREITGTSGGGQGGDAYGDSILEGLSLKETWFSPGDWSGGLDPQAKFEGGTLTLTCPEGIGGGEWQGQVKLVANVPADPAVEYSFSCTIESSTDGTCTVKVADANADAAHAFFYDNNVALAAYEEVSYVNAPVSPDQAYEAVMVIFDFGRMAAGTEITVTDIALCPKK